jgi:hypothetical protein
VHSGSDDEFALFVMRTDLTDDDVDCHEGRQIVFVDPGRVPALDLTAAAKIALPRFLDSEHYRRMTT